MSKTAPTAALVVTTINEPVPIMKNLAKAASKANVPFFVIGDAKSPASYLLPAAEFFSLEIQHKRFGAFSQMLPTGHYVRKNLGYLAALETGAQWIVETDDDNDPLPGFLTPPSARLNARTLKAGAAWVNAYDFFGPSQSVWPRGLPLDEIQGGQIQSEQQEKREVDAKIIQGLADENPDVDAVYRLTRPLPVHFDLDAEPLALSANQWCPFNSQNTWFHRDVATLLYLPAYCSFRMTDIWRSFIAQRCLWAVNGQLIFVAATVRQERNEHNLMRDFADEVPGYLANESIRQCLSALQLSGDPSADLMACYVALVERGIFDKKELQLVEQWLVEVGERK